MIRALILALSFIGFLFFGEWLLFYKFTPYLGKAYWLIPLISYGLFFLPFSRKPPSAIANLVRGLAGGLLISKVVMTPFLLLAFVFESGLLFNIGLFIGGLVFLSILHGITRGKYLYQVKNVTLKFPELPEAFDGFRLAQISDIHAGSFDNPKKVEKGVDLVNEQGADVIVFTGDLINHNKNEIISYYDIFSKLNAPMGVWSVVGNHDYYQFGGQFTEGELAKLFIDQHKSAGFDLLLDEHIKLEKDGAFIYLIGVENWGEPPFPQRGDLDAAAEGADEDTVRILLSHDPTHWSNKVLQYPKKIHLTLSGHTHAMQFGINFGPIRFSPVQFRYKHWMGLYEEAGQYLYVNRGFGFHGFSGRVGMFPEITVFELKKA